MKRVITELRRRNADDACKVDFLCKEEVFFCMAGCVQQVISKLNEFELQYIEKCYNKTISSIIIHHNGDNNIIQI